MPGTDNCEANINGLARQTKQRLADLVLDIICWLRDNICNVLNIFFIAFSDTHDDYRP